MPVSMTKIRSVKTNVRLGSQVPKRSLGQWGIRPPRFLELSEKEMESLVSAFVGQTAELWKENQWPAGVRGAGRACPRRLARSSLRGPGQAVGGGSPVPLAWDVGSGGAVSWLWAGFPRGKLRAARGLGPCHPCLWPQPGLGAHGPWKPGLDKHSRVLSSDKTSPASLTPLQRLRGSAGSTCDRARGSGHK